MAAPRRVDWLSIVWVFLSLRPSAGSYYSCDKNTSCLCNEQTLSCTTLPKVGNSSLVLSHFNSLQVIQTGALDVSNDTDISTIWIRHNGRLNEIQKEPFVLGESNSITSLVLQNLSSLSEVSPCFITEEYEYLQTIQLITLKSLTNINFLAGIHLPVLHSLHVYDIPIEYLSRSMFQNMSSLTQLYLGETKLRTVDFCTLYPFYRHQLEQDSKHVKEFSICTNTLQCSCENAYLRRLSSSDYAQRYPIDSVFKGSCAPAECRDTTGQRLSFRDYSTTESCLNIGLNENPCPDELYEASRQCKSPPETNSTAETPISSSLQGGGALSADPAFCRSSSETCGPGRVCINKACVHQCSGSARKCESPKAKCMSGFCVCQNSFLYNSVQQCGSNRTIPCLEADGCVQTCEDDVECHIIETDGTTSDSRANCVEGLCLCPNNQVKRQEMTCDGTLIGQPSPEGNQPEKHIYIADNSGVVTALAIIGGIAGVFVLVGVVSSVHQSYMGGPPIHIFDDKNDADGSEDEDESNWQSNRRTSRGHSYSFRPSRQYPMNGIDSDSQDSNSEGIGSHGTPTREQLYRKLTLTGEDPHLHHIPASHTPPHGSTAPHHDPLPIAALGDEPAIPMPSQRRRSLFDEHDIRRYSLAV